ncbi:sugar ABC transporter substrate-binding protein [Pseudooceanicola sp. CBS1P-1]|uniref:Extracellular solute-binding protein n=1 Tax=Pseudooceanicola albus TaxID=2692189 RepID=A0A6L7G3B9_9RHOB|nr:MULTISPECIES: sugar ABC transporter substrate-binding protein [Pseudooceanicola]MBT9385207.1 sugar ABC transporter substrate-binding protein [Pseudooceanicola endophyticus]MXN18501.1 extracellular solute-binding protein [Pseudooceanicola albus]
MKKMTTLLGAALLASTAATSAFGAETLHMIMCGDDTTPGIPVQQGLISDWEKQNPDFKVEVEFVPWGQCQEKSMTLAAAGNPAALSYMGSRTLKQLAKNGLIIPMDLTDEEKASYAAPILGTVTWDGKIWGLPRAFSTKALFYNKKLFKEAGLDPEKGPQTFDELLADAKVITEKTDAAGYAMAGASFDNSMHQFLNLVYSNGGQVIDADGNIDFDSANNVQTMELVKNLVPYAEPGPVAYNRGKLETLMGEEKAAMMIDGHWLYDRVPADVDMGVVPVPAGPMGKHSSLLITDSLAVFKGSGQEDAAMSLAKFLTSPDHQMAYDIAEGYTPIRGGQKVDELLAKDPSWKPFIDIIPAGGPEPFVTDYVSMQDSINEALQGVILGEVDPKEAIETAAENLEDAQ